MLLKKIFFVLFGIILFISCSSDDDSSFHYELLPVEDAIVPIEFEYGEIYNITIKYILPNECYVYSDVLYEYDYVARNIAVISTVLENKNCEELNYEQELTFRVQALQSSPYIFKFWQGDDENGNPIYLIKEVPVVINNNKKAHEFTKTHKKM